MTNFWNLNGGGIDLIVTPYGNVDHYMSENGKKKSIDENEDSSVRQSGKSLDPTVQKHIGKQLRELYDGVLDEPIPDRFKELLDRLEESQELKKKN